jgi:hypothetical protein
MSANTNGTDMPPWEKAAVGVAGALAAWLVVMEWADDDWESFFTRHPLLTGLISGGLLLAPLLLVVERSLGRRALRAEKAREEREQERLRKPALNAIDTFRQVATPIGALFHEALWRAVERTPTPGKGKPVEELVPLLARVHPTGFADVESQLRRESAVSGARAADAVAMLALYPPMSELAERCTAVQEATNEMADRCGELAASQSTDDAIAALVAAYERRAELLAALTTAFAQQDSAGR